MKQEKLYLICPDCDIEQAVRNKFGKDVYFLTALGSVFDFSQLEYAAALDDLITREIISEVIVLNDTRCTFINNIIGGEINYNTKAEQELQKLQKNHADSLATLDISNQRRLLAKLNIQRQIYELLDVPLVGGKIDDETLKVSGLIYNRDTERFEPITLNV